MKLTKEQLLEKFLKWAKTEDNIRVVILEGSGGGNKKTDEFSDFDISLICKDPIKLTKDNSWYENINKVWVCLPLSFVDKGTEIFTRLTMYEGGAKIDYGIYPVKFIADIVKTQKLPQRYKLGYKVLLDKDNIVKFPKADYKIYPTEEPGQKEFFRWVNTFFYEVAQMPMYLVRGDLWHNKLRDWTLKEYTLRMLELNEKAKNGWDYNVSTDGKKMKKWLSEKNWNLIKDTFGHFDAKDSWDSLFKTTKAFSIIARETAKLLNYKYPENIDKNITEYIKEIYKKYKK